jgi:hypothetical protein
MPFSTRNPAELVLNKTYRFTRDINGHSYLMTLRKTRTENIWWQDCQYTGIRPGHPTSTVYDFDTVHANGCKGAIWIWEKEYDDKVCGIRPCKSDGVWTEIEDDAVATVAAATPTTPEYS